MNVTNNLNIDWNEIDPRFKFATLNTSGMVMLFTKRPQLLDSGWWDDFSTSEGNCYILDEKYFLNKQIDWKNTLTERPLNHLMKIKMEVSNMLNIDWDKVDPKFNFALMGSSGKVLLFSEHPELLESKESLGGWRLAYILGSVDIYTSDGNSLLKEPVHWVHTLTERPLVKMKVTNILNINWGDIDPKFNFAAMDAGGWVSLFTERPEIVDFGWCKRSTLDLGFSYTWVGESLLKEQVNWKDTLTVRPVAK